MCVCVGYSVDVRGAGESFQYAARRNAIQGIVHVVIHVFSKLFGF